MELKQLRQQKGITQVECAQYLGVPLRTYKTYENDERKQQTIKYKYMVEKLNSFGKIDEEHGILAMQQIIDKCGEVFKGYDIDYCYLFGSYAKGNATPTSDVDLLISSNVSGLAFFGLAEELRTALCKKVDLLNQDQLHNNPTLANEILKDGVKIYG
jgi:hypothetical protein